MTGRVIGDGPLATALGAVADVAGQAVFVVPGVDADAAAVIARLREAARGTDALVLVLSKEASPLDRVLLLAAVAPLAIELAPATRISAVDEGPDATVSAIVDAALFLAGATSTTGQVLRIG